MLPVKRRRLDVQQRVQSEFLVNNNEGVISHIYGFLEAADFVQHQLINRFAAEFLPQCVTTISMELRTARRAFASPNTSLAKYSHLQRLAIFHHKAVESASSSSSTACPVLLPVRTRDRGEDVMLNIARSFEAGMFPRLTHLSIQSACINSTTANSIPSLIKALGNGKHQAFTVLDIAATCAGDDSAVAIAELMQSGQCPKLSIIDARKNFIGERGSLAIASALRSSSCARLRCLRLSDNLIIDTGLEAISHALHTYCENNGSPIQLVSLEGNFISKQTIELCGTFPSYHVQVARSPAKLHAVAAATAGI